MSTSYIPEGTYAVCTFQMGATPQKLVASRSKVSVFHKGKPLLTMEDKNIEFQFSCKSPVSLAASFLAFGAGLIMGAALFLSGPIGWIVAAGGCLAVVIGVAYRQKAITHKCTGPMKAGQWMLYQPKVKFNGHNAITEMSMLSCSNGGIVKPFFSYSLACAAAQEISSNNKVEVGVNSVISFFAGLLLPKAIGGITTRPKAVAFLVTNIGGLGVTWTAQHIEREIMRNDSDLRNNTTYQNMNEEVDKNTFFQTLDDPSDFNDLKSLVFLQQAIKEGKIVSQNLSVNQTLSYFANMTTAQLKNSAEYRQFLSKVGKGVYGSDLKQSMSNLFGRLKPNRTSVIKGMGHSAQRFNSSFKSMAKAGGKGALFFLPWVSTYFSEKTRKAFAKEAQKDMGNGINVVTTKPLG